MSGPPVIIALLGSGLPIQATRATLMAFIAVSAALGISIAIASGLYTSEALVTTLIMVPCAAIGALVGSAMFARTPDARYRPASLAILFIVACVAVVGAYWRLLQS
jgi:uncharacterized membrane protein YfcA